MTNKERGRVDPVRSGVRAMTVDARLLCWKTPSRRDKSGQLRQIVESGEGAFALIEAAASGLPVEVFEVRKIMAFSR
jgi:hypothetical protein